MDFNNQEQPWYKRLWFIITASVIAVLILVGAIIGIVFALKGDDKEELPKGENYVELNIDWTEHAKTAELDNFTIPLKNGIEKAALSGTFTLDVKADISPIKQTMYFDVILYGENVEYVYDSVVIGGETEHIEFSAGQAMVEMNHLISTKGGWTSKSWSGSIVTDAKYSDYIENYDGSNETYYDDAKFDKHYMNNFTYYYEPVDYATGTYFENLDLSFESGTGAHEDIYLVNPDETLELIESYNADLYLEPWASAYWYEESVGNGWYSNNLPESVINQIENVLYENINIDNFENYLFWGNSYFLNGYQPN